MVFSYNFFFKKSIAFVFFRDSMRNFALYFKKIRKRGVYIFQKLPDREKNHSHFLNRTISFTLSKIRVLNARIGNVEREKSGYNYAMTRRRNNRFVNSEFSQIHEF